MLLRGRRLSVPSKANIYQYYLQSQHLLVSLMKLTPTSIFAEPTPTSTHYKTIIYQYPIVQDDANIVQGTDFSMVRGAVFSIVRGAVFSIVRGDAFTIV